MTPHCLRLYTFFVEQNKNLCFSLPLLWMPVKSPSWCTQTETVTFVVYQGGEMVCAKVWEYSPSHFRFYLPLSLSSTHKHTHVHTHTRTHTYTYTHTHWHTHTHTHTLNLYYVLVCHAIQHLFFPFFVGFAKWQYSLIFICDKNQWKYLLLLLFTSNTTNWSKNAWVIKNYVVVENI